MNLKLVIAMHSFFARRGVESYLVGGTVRDLLLGDLNPHADLDWVVPRSSEPLALARALADALHGRFVPLHAEHGTARVVFMDELEDRTIVDLAELRAPSLHEDLGLRDFTINAMALDPQQLTGQSYGETGRMQVIDPHQGQADLATRQVRVISERSFLDDPLRLLRAVRMAAQLGFEIEPETVRLIQKHAPRILKPAVERVRDELIKILAHPASARYLHLMAELGLLFYMLPEIDETAPPLMRVEALERVIQQTGPQVEAALQAGSDHNRAVMLRLAALLYHAGEQGALGALERLRFSRNDLRTASLALRLLPGLDLLLAAGGGSRADRWSFYRAAGDESVAVVLLWLALRGDEPDRRVFLEAALHERSVMLDIQPLLTGDDLQAVFSIPPGPQIKTILDALRTAQLNGHLHSRSEALAYVTDLLRDTSGK